MGYHSTCPVQENKRPQRIFPSGSFCQIERRAGQSNSFCVLKVRFTTTRSRRMDTLQQIQEVFRNIFDDETITISRDTTAEDIEAWDSVQNVTLMLEVESEFGVRFSTSEIAYLKHVGELVDLVEKKIQKKK